MAIDDPLDPQREPRNDVAWQGILNPDAQTMFDFLNPQRLPYAPENQPAERPSFDLPIENDPTISDTFSRTGVDGGPSTLAVNSPTSDWPPANADPIQYLFPDPQPVEETTTFNAEGNPVATRDSSRETPGSSTPPFYQAVNDLFSLGTPEGRAELGPKTMAAAKQKADADERDTRFGIGAMQHRTGELERIRNAEAYTIGTLPPAWDEKKESAERIRGPIESFGSVASIFALAASAFTKQPMINALSGAAAAMTAIHQNDLEGYERGYKAWKDNTELVEKRFNMERNVFQDTSALFDKDAGLWRAKMEANAARFNDQHMMALLNAGLDGEVFKLMESRNQAFDKSIESKKKFEDFDTRQRYLDAIKGEIEKHPDWDETQQAYYGMLALNESQSQTEDQRALASALRSKFIENGGKLSSEDITNIRQRFHYSGGLQKGSAQSVARTAEALIKKGVPEEEAWPMAEQLVAEGKEAPKVEGRLRLEDKRAQNKLAQIDKTGILRKEITEMQQKGANHRTEFSAEARAVEGKLNREEREFIEAMKEDAAAERQREKIESTPDSQFIERFNAENPNATAAEFKKAYDEFKQGQKAPTGGGGGILTPARIDAKEEARLIQENIDKGMSPGDAFKAAKKTVAEAGKVLTAAQKDKIDSLISRYDEADNTINQIEDLLRHKKAWAGLSGKIAKPNEIIRNWFGSDVVSQARYESLMARLQTWATGLLTEQQSRPLSMAEARVAQVVPGMSVGDTTISTQKRLRDLQELFKHMRETARQRREGTYDPSKPVETPKSDKWWKNLPDKKSEISNTLAAFNPEEGAPYQVAGDVVPLPISPIVSDTRRLNNEKMLADYRRRFGNAVVNEWLKSLGGAQSPTPGPGYTP